MHCPSCGGSDIRESLHNGLRDELLGMFGFVAYRCRACRRRFYRRPPDEDSAEEFEEAKESGDRETDGDRRR